MIIAQAIIFGSLALGGRWYRERARRDEAPAAPEPPRDETAAGSPAADSPPDDPAVDEELALLDRDLALSATGLASVGAGALIRPALGLLAAPCVAVALIPMARQGWADSREKGRLSYHGFEAITAAVTLLGGHVVVSAMGLTAFLAGRRVLLTTRRSAQAELDARLGRIEGEQPAPVLDLGDRNEAEDMADATIAPTMVAGALGLGARGFAGGIAGLWANAMEIAWLGAPLALLSLTRAAADHGLLIRDGRTVERLAAIDAVVFGPDLDPDPGVVQALRQRGLRVLTRGGYAAQIDRPLALGLDGEPPAEADPLAETIAALSGAGHTVCVVARGWAARPAMAAAHVTVAAPLEQGDPHADAQVVLLGGRLDGLDALFDLSRRHDRVRDRMFALAAVPSVLAVGAVIFAGVGPVAVIGAHAGALGIGVGLGLRERGWTPSEAIEASTA